MSGIAFLRDLAKSAREDKRPIFAPNRLRFVLEALRPGATPAKAAAALSTDVSGLIGASTFDLQPLFDDAEANGVQFFVMALRGIDRTLPRNSSMPSPPTFDVRSA
ncbi:hypothetical protein NLY33_00180 [Mesorhizobium sp. C432A]|uniref:hypothetical protein n=1 Tax=Mesorhizobium sp. C432A TaxID=2956836 RepID=UPI0025782A54|nr:hypothetical protein [Mesorhizobium sp. C432A]WJI57224.1 hypothetical protein NLY33_00180 [Mesorhizobium sp. C432A]